MGLTKHRHQFEKEMEEFRIEAEANYRNAEREKNKMAEVRAANYSISEDETEENKFIREELLKKWDNIVQRKNSIDKLKLF